MHYPAPARRGKDFRVRDVCGREYLDFSLNEGSLLLGHAHPKVVSALKRALSKDVCLPFLGTAQKYFIDFLVRHHGGSDFNIFLFPTANYAIHNIEKAIGGHCLRLSSLTTMSNNLVSCCFHDLDFCQDIYSLFQDFLEFQNEHQVFDNFCCFSKVQSDRELLNHEKPVCSVRKVGMVLASMAFYCFKTKQLLIRPLSWWNELKMLCKRFGMLLFLDERVLFARIEEGNLFRSVVSLVDGRIVGDGGGGGFPLGIAMIRKNIELRLFESSVISNVACVAGLATLRFMRLQKKEHAQVLRCHVSKLRDACEKRNIVFSNVGSVFSLDICDSNQKKTKVGLITNQFVNSPLWFLSGEMQDFHVKAFLKRCWLLLK